MVLYFAENGITKIRNGARPHIQATIAWPQTM